MTYKFDLIESPWIRVTQNDGLTRREVGLLEALCNAHQFRVAYGDNATETAALHRLLLAILHRAYKGPANPNEWGAIWGARRFDERTIAGYLRSQVGRFDLFDQERPFYQDKSGGALSRETTIAKLRLDRACGNNTTITDHSIDSAPEAITPAKAARVLLSIQAFSYGGARVFKDAPLARGCIFLAEGRSLFETLALNLLPYQTTLSDLPCWEMTDPYNPDRDPYGWLDQLTWQSRRICLIPEVTPEGVRVSQMTWRPGLAMNPTTLDDMKTYYTRPDGTTAPVRTPRNSHAAWHNLSRAIVQPTPGGRSALVFAWLKQLVADGYLSADTPVALAYYEMQGMQGRVDGLIEDHLPLAVTRIIDLAQSEALGRAIELAETVRRRLYLALARLYSENLTFGKKQAGRGDKQTVANQINHSRWEQQYWSRLLYHYLSLGQEIDLVGWRQALEQEAKAVFKTCGLGGANPREMRAMSLAQNQLNGSLRKVLKSEEA